MSTKQYPRQCTPGLAPRGHDADADRHPAASPRTGIRPSVLSSTSIRDARESKEAPPVLTPVQSLSDAELKHAIRELTIVQMLPGAGDVRLGALKNELERRRVKRRGEEVAR